MSLLVEATAAAEERELLLDARTSNVVKCVLWEGPRGVVEHERGLQAEAEDERLLASGAAACSTLSTLKEFIVDETGVGVVYLYSLFLPPRDDGCFLASLNQRTDFFEQNGKTLAFESRLSDGGSLGLYVEAPRTVQADHTFLEASFAAVGASPVFTSSSADDWCAEVTCSAHLPGLRKASATCFSRTLTAARGSWGIRKLATSSELEALLGGGGGGGAASGPRWLDVEVALFVHHDRAVKHRVRRRLTAHTLMSGPPYRCAVAPMRPAHAFAAPLFHILHSVVEFRNAVHAAAAAAAARGDGGEKKVRLLSGLSGLFARMTHAGDVGARGDGAVRYTYLPETLMLAASPCGGLNIERDVVSYLQVLFRSASEAAAAGEPCLGTPPLHAAFSGEMAHDIVVAGLSGVGEEEDGAAGRRCGLSHGGGGGGGGGSGHRPRVDQERRTQEITGLSLSVAAAAATAAGKAGEGEMPSTVRLEDCLAEYFRPASVQLGEGGKMQSVAAAAAAAMRPGGPSVLDECLDAHFNGGALSALGVPTLTITRRVAEPPRVLLVHLERAQQQQAELPPRRTRLSYGVHLDLTPHCEAGAGRARYRLAAVWLVEGGGGGGGSGSGEHHLYLRGKEKPSTDNDAGAAAADDSPFWCRASGDLIVRAPESEVLGDDDWCAAAAAAAADDTVALSPGGRGYEDRFWKGARTPVMLVYTLESSEREAAGEGESPSPSPSPSPPPLPAALRRHYRVCTYGDLEVYDAGFHADLYKFNARASRVLSVDAHSAHPIRDLCAAAAAATGAPADAVRLWRFVRRKNGSYRPQQLLRSRSAVDGVLCADVLVEELQPPLSDSAAIAAAATGESLLPPLCLASPHAYVEAMFAGEEDEEEEEESERDEDEEDEACSFGRGSTVVMLLVKVFDPEQAFVRFAGQAYVRDGDQVSDFIEKLRADLGGDELLGAEGGAARRAWNDSLHEEVSGQVPPLPRRVDPALTFHAAGLATGDIVVYSLPYAPARLCAAAAVPTIVGAEGGGEAVAPLVTYFERESAVVDVEFVCAAAYPSGEAARWSAKLSLPRDATYSDACAELANAVPGLEVCAHPPTHTHTHHLSPPQASRLLLSPHEDPSCVGSEARDGGGGVLAARGPLSQLLQQSSDGETLVFSVLDSDAASASARLDPIFFCFLLFEEGKTGWLAAGTVDPAATTGRVLEWIMTQFDVLQQEGELLAHEQVVFIGVEHLGWPECNVLETDIHGPVRALLQRCRHIAVSKTGRPGCTNPATGLPFMGVQAVLWFRRCGCGGGGSGGGGRRRRLKLEELTCASQVEFHSAPLLFAFDKTSTMQDVASRLRLADGPCCGAADELVPFVVVGESPEKAKLAQLAPGARVCTAIVAGSAMRASDDEYVHIAFCCAPRPPFTPPPPSLVGPRKGGGGGSGGGAAKKGL